MPVISAVQSQLKEHEQWLVGLRQDSRMTLAKIRTELEKQKDLTVNSSQLETYFRNLGQRKNLSPREWITVFCALDSQKAFGRFFDFYLSGKPIEGESLQKKRKHAKPVRPLATCLADADQLIKQLPDGVTVRLRLPQDSDDAGQQHKTTAQLTLPEIHAANPEREASMPPGTVAPDNRSVSGPSAVVSETAAVPSPFGSRATSTRIVSQTQLADFPANMETHSAPSLEVPQDSNVLISSPALEMNYDLENLDMVYGDSNPLGSNIWDERYMWGSPVNSWPSLQNQAGAANRNIISSASLDFMSWTDIALGHSIHELCLIEPFRLLAENCGSTTYQWVRRRRLARPQPLPTAQELLDNLQSLVSLDIAEGNFSGPLDFIGGPGLLTDEFVQLFLFSVVNNFAGIDVLPKARIIQFINQHEPARSTILSHLKNGASTVFSSALAEKLLEPAIDAGDAKTVQELLELRIFKPDDIVCTFASQRRTPLEKASSLHHFDIAVALLRFGADVNKTYTDATSHLERGALECAIGMWGHHRQVDLWFVDLLFESGAVVSSRVAAAAIRWGDDGLIQKLISRLSPSEHARCFSSMLNDAAEYLKNEVGLRVVRQLIQACRDIHDNACIRSKQHVVVEAMAKAAGRKNDDLLYLLLPHGGQVGLDTTLMIASRYGSHALVRWLLAHGACADGPARSVDGPGKAGLPPLRSTMRSTSLSEAIRGKDAELVDILSKAGAWNQIGESGRLKAVMFAIAESGQWAFLDQVLKLVPNPDPDALTGALSAAIRQRHEDIALKLVGLDVDVNYYRDIESPLVAALRIKSHRIVWAILESNVQLHDERFFDSEGYSEGYSGPTQTMEAATAWGDPEVIKTLVLMGADINTYLCEAPLSIAIKAGKRSLIDLLINLGADLNSQAEPDFSYKVDSFSEVAREDLWSHKDDPPPRWCSSPLAAAALVHDSETANYLLEHGADPADERAIIKAAIHDRSLLKLILQSFSERYPKGRTGFGGTVLQFGIQTDNEALLDVCLSAAFDVNSLARHKRYEEYENGKDDEDCDDDEAYGQPEDYGVVTALGMVIKKYRGDRLDLISKLLGAGGDVNAPTSVSHQDVSPAGTRVGLRKVITVRQTALLDAIETKSLPLVELLICQGADVRKEAKLGLKRTPLQKACEVASPTIVDLLLGLDIDVNAAPAAHGGATALQLAAKIGSMRIAKKLLNSGANVNAPGAKVWGRSAIEYAAEYGRLNMITVLCNAVGRKLAAGQYESAIALAQENGHPACAVLLQNLSSGNQGYIGGAAWQMPQSYDGTANVVGL